MNFVKHPHDSFLKKLKQNIGFLLRTNRYAKISELLLLFVVAFIFIKLFESQKSEDLIYNQMVKWLANVFMLLFVWGGLKLRGEDYGHFGLTFKKLNSRAAFKMFWQSILVFILGIAGFMIGAILMVNIYGVPESADMSGYNYLKGNIWMLCITLGGVYIVSSFGEEIIYRAFLMRRISELGLHGKIGNTVTVLASAIVFGLIHYSWGIVGIVQTTFMGLALCICYLVLKKKIWPLILAHAYMDTILVLQMYFA